jgi:hypothetical protein
VVENLRQLLPGAALRSNVAGGIPDRQSNEKLTVVFADHASYLPALPKALAQRCHTQQSRRTGAPTSTDLARCVFEHPRMSALARSVRQSGIVVPSVNHP